MQEVLEIVYRAWKPGKNVASIGAAASTTSTIRKRKGWTCGKLK